MPPEERHVILCDEKRYQRLLSVFHRRRRRVGQEPHGSFRYLSQRGRPR